MTTATGLRTLPTRVPASEPAHLTYRRIIHEVQAEGCGLSFQGNAIDAAVAAGATCANCGHSGLNYEAWRRVEPRAYHAVSVCPACGYAERWWVG